MKGFTLLACRAEARFDESMDSRLFDEWAQIDDHLRRVISARDAGQFAPASSAQDLTLVVAGADVRTYARVKHAVASRSVDVILDRRIGERRRVSRPTLPDRRYADRRKCEETKSVQAYSYPVGSASR